MAVRRLVLVGLAAAGAYGAWRALQQPAGSGSTGGGGPAPSAAAAAAASATALPDQSTPLPPEPTGGPGASGTAGRGTAGPASGSAGPAHSGPGAPAGSGGAPDLEAATTALDGTATGPDRDALAVPSAHGPDPARGADVEGGAGSPAAGTRGEDPLTGLTEPASALPEATASPDGTPAAGPVETRRVGEEPA